jgi:hypothetical protein
MWLLLLCPWLFWSLLSLLSLLLSFTALDLNSCCCCQLRQQH